MKFGKKAGTITPTQNATGDWPKSLRSGETRVRILTEIPEWQEYWEHYDETVKYFPCTEDKKTCPGCTSTEERTRRASKRYLAPVLDPRTGRVYGLKIPLDLANRLSLRNDRNNGTITNRDYTLIRTGSGLETDYDVEQEEKVPIDLTVYADTVDLEQMLSSQFAAAWPNFDPDNPPNGKAPTRRRRPRADDDEQPEKTMTKELADRAKTAPGRTEDGGYTDDPPSEAPAEPASAPAEETAGAQVNEDDDGVVEITEEDLRKMTRPDLIKLARQAELPITLTMNRDQIVDMFLDQFAG